MVAVGAHAAGDRVGALLLGRPVLPTGDPHAGDEPAQVPLPRPGMGLVEVVEVEDEVALGRGVEAEVAQVRVAADDRQDAGGRQPGEVLGHDRRGAAQEGERARRPSARSAPGSACSTRPCVAWRSPGARGRPGRPAAPTCPATSAARAVAAPGRARNARRAGWPRDAATRTRRGRRHRARRSRGRGAAEGRAAASPRSRGRSGRRAASSRRDVLACRSRLLALARRQRFRPGMVPTREDSRPATPMQAASRPDFGADRAVRRGAAPSAGRPAAPPAASSRPAGPAPPRRTPRRPPRTRPLPPPRRCRRAWWRGRPRAA